MSFQSHFTTLPARLFTVLAAFACLAAHALAAAPVAMVTDLKGRASHAGSSGKPLAILAELPADAELILGPGGDLTLVYIGSGHEFHFTGSGRITVGANLPTFIGQGKLSSKTSLLSSAGGKLNTDGGRMVQGAIVMRGTGERPRQIGPRQKALETRPTFRWVQPAAIRTVTFELRSEGMQTIATATVTGESYSLPPGLELVPGKTYTWSITPQGEAGADRMVTDFVLASPAERERLLQFRPDRDASYSDKVLYALLLEQHGFSGDAAGHWKELSDARPEDPGLRAKWAR